MPAATTLNAVDEPPAHSANPIGWVVILVFGFTFTVTIELVEGSNSCPSASVEVLYLTLKSLLVKINGDEDKV